MIEERGRGEFLTGLAAELRDGTYKPRPYRRREIPKEGGKVRVISSPRSETASCRAPSGYFWNPSSKPTFRDTPTGRGRVGLAHDAIGEVRSGLIWKKHLVVDVDLKSFFDDIGTGRCSRRWPGGSKTTGCSP